MELRPPDAQMLPSYIDALERGWAPSNVDSENRRRDSLERISRDQAAFLAEFVDGEASGPPIVLPDGTEIARLPDIARWMWDGEFCGLINLRWQPGTSALPEHTLGHVGYTVVPWKRGRGYATRALIGMLDHAREQGLEWIDLTTRAANTPSWRVIEKAGGRLVEEMTGVIHHPPDEVVRLYRIAL